MIGLMSALLVTALGAELEVESKVTDVTVYGDRARVTRVATATVPAGRTDLVFEDLSIHLLPASLAAAGEGMAGATLTGIDMRPQRGTEDRDAEVARLEKDKRGYGDKVAAQQDTITRVNHEIAFVQGIKPIAPKQLDKATFLAEDAPEQLAALSAQMGEDLGALFVALRKAEREQRELRKEIARIDRELAVLRRPNNTDSRRVAVGLDTARGGRVTVRLEYVVTGASWSPKYDARYDLKTGKIRLDVAGQVRQNTGETWNDVALTLSTARPNQSTAPPKLQPYTLGQGGPGGGARVGIASLADKVTAFEFTASRKETVPSDGTLRRVSLTGVELGADVVHKVVPRRLESAWLTARATNTADFPILPGPVSSYLGTAYVGDGALELAVPGEELDLSFGVDDRVGVKRAPLENLEGEGKGLVNKDHKSYGFKTTIKNRTGKAIQLEVADQVPVSRDAAFEVKSKTTPEVAIPEGTGLFTWKLELANGADTDLVLEYEVIWPKGDRPVLLE